MSVTEAGAPAAAARKLGAAALFAARVGPGERTGEWAIPFTAAGIVARPGLEISLNAGVRRAESEEWIQWRGSGATGNLRQAGTVVLE